MERKTVRSRRTSERLLILSNRCEMCDKVFPRGEKAQHETELSPMRVVGCQYCLTERVKAKDINKHFIMCPDYPITYHIDYEAKFTKVYKKGIDSKQI